MMAWNLYYFWKAHFKWKFPLMLLSDQIQFSIFAKLNLIAPISSFCPVIFFRPLHTVTSSWTNLLEGCGNQGCIQARLSNSARSSSWLPHSLEIFHRIVPQWHASGNGGFHPIQFPYLLLIRHFLSSIFLPFICVGAFFYGNDFQNWCCWRHSLYFVA